MARLRRLAEASLVAALALASPLEAIEVREAHYVMGTLLEIAVDAPDDATARRWIRLGIEEGRRLDRELTTYDPASPTMELNRAAGAGEVKVPPDLHRVLTLSLVFAERTSGLFDPTVGPLVSLLGGDPTAAEMAAARALVGASRVRVEPPDRAELPREGMAVDFGAIGKGYAADRIAELLEREGAERVLVDFGQSSTVARGDPPWRIGVRDATGGVAGALLLDDRALSSSWTHREDDLTGERRPHLVDPRSGDLVRSERRVTVVAPNGTVAEVWSTAIAVDPDVALPLLRPEDGVEAIVFEEAGARRTAGFSAIEVVPRTSDVSAAEEARP